MIENVSRLTRIGALGFALVVAACSSPAASPIHEVGKASLRPGRAAQSSGLTGLPGSRIRFQLPEGFQRPTRAPKLTDAKRNIAIELFEVSASESEASTAVSDMRKSLDERTKSVDINLTTGGTQVFAVVGTDTDGREQLYTVLRRGGAVAMVTFTYPTSMREIVHSIARSLLIDTHARLEPAKLNGLEVGQAEGLGVDENLSMIIVHDVNLSPPLPPASPTIDFTFVQHGTEDRAVPLHSLDALLDDDIDRKTVKATDVQFDKLAAVEFVGEAVDRGVRVQTISVFAVEQGAILHMRGRSASTDDLSRLRKVIYGTRRVTLPPGAIPMSAVDVGASAGAAH